MKGGIILLFILLCFCSCDRKLREAEKIYDKLDLEINDQELIDRLDLLEESLSKLPNAYYINMHSGGIRFNEPKSFIKSEDVNAEFLSRSPINSGVFKLEEIQNIVELYKIIVQNQITIQDFTSNYACNGETIFWYKKGQCGPNNYCERKLYIRKSETVDFDCFNDESDLLGQISKMTPIDSIGNIYLLKPTRYIR
ncbi:hypothetical protein [uncultured Roseivirga sp.]|uniref:hypothetical protein n=1 Tax=uncultured Roseivirga sp. TaxID=543088 RepID=UPI0032B1E5C0